MKKGVCLIHQLKWLIELFGLKKVKGALLRIEEIDFNKKGVK